MKAREENSVIKTYKRVPKVWNSHINFRSGGDELHESEGFFHYMIPAIDESIERIGEIFFDTAAEIFTHLIVPLTQEEIDDLARSTERGIRVEALGLGINLIDNGEEFYFNEEEFSKFVLFSEATNGSMKWYNTSNILINLNQGRRNRIQTSAGNALLAIRNQ